MITKRAKTAAESQLQERGNITVIFYKNRNYENPQELIFSTMDEFENFIDNQTEYDDLFIPNPEYF